MPPEISKDILNRLAEFDSCSIAVVGKTQATILKALGCVGVITNGAPLGFARLTNSR